jgi:deoxyribonuclease IV
MKIKKFLLGGHVSIAGGLSKALIRGDSIHCTALQMFTRSNRQWAAKPLTQEEIACFSATWKATGIEEIVVHLPYLLNLGSPDVKLRHASVVAVQEELERCAALNINYLVLHPGSHLGSDEEKCIDYIIEGINQALTNNQGRSMILLENMAGQGTNVGYNFTHLATIMAGVDHKKRVGICFDTCHAFAAGYDLRTPAAYEATWHEFDRVIGLKHLKVMHLNDSKKELGSRVDRHEEIGDGKIGLSGFKLLVNDERLVDVPKILETPKATLESYAKNMETLKHLLTPHMQKMFGM